MQEDRKQKVLTGTVRKAGPKPAVQGKNPEALKALSAAYKAIDGKFGRETVMLDISGVSILADYFIIATANNPAQLRAMADEVTGRMAACGTPLLHSEGMQSLKWVLLDFGCVIAHLFLQEDRDFYGIERIWGDAGKVAPEELEI